MPSMAASSAADDFLASHIGQLLVRQPLPKSASGSLSKRSSANTTPAGSAPTPLSPSSSHQGHTRTYSERSTSERASFATTFGAPVRRISISNARCSSISSETTSYFDQKQRSSAHAKGARSQSGSVRFSPTSPVFAAVKWNTPVVDEEGSSAFAAALQSSSAQNSPSVGQDFDTQALLDDQPLLSPSASVCSSTHGGPSVYSGRSRISSSRGFRRALALIPADEEGRNFTFVEPLSANPDSDDEITSTAQTPQDEEAVTKPTASQPTTTVSLPSSSATDAVNARPRKASSRAESTTVSDAPKSSRQEQTHEDFARSSRTVTFALKNVPAASKTSLTTSESGTRTLNVRNTRTRHITILPRDTQKMTLLEQTMANERARRKIVDDETARRQERAKASSVTLSSDSNGSDHSYTPIVPVEGERSYRLRPDSDEDRNRAEADTAYSHPKSSQRTNNWARDQNRFTSPPLRPSSSAEALPALSKEGDAFALPPNMASSEELRPFGHRGESGYSSNTCSTSPAISDMQDMRTGHSETFTALSSPAYELDEPVVVGQKAKVTPSENAEDASQQFPIAVAT